MRSSDLFSSAGAPGDAIRFILQPGEESVPLRTALESLEQPSQNVYIAIGPEGGWSPDELTSAQAAGWRRIGIGKYVLRTETAALVAMSQIMFCIEV